MKIIVENKEKVKITIHLPTFFLHSKMFCKIICQKSEEKELATFINSLAKQIRKYTRKNGSFDLIELETKESEKVIIRV